MMRVVGGIRIKSVACALQRLVSCLPAALRRPRSSCQAGRRFCKWRLVQLYVCCPLPGPPQEFKLPPGRGEAAKELLGAVNNVIAFLVACRPLSVTMGNAIKYIKCELERLKLQPALSEQQVGYFHFLCHS